MLKIISVSLLSLGLATSVMAQEGGSQGQAGASQGQSGDSTNKVDPGPMNGPKNTDAMPTNSTRTNCAPNMQTSGTASQTDKTGTASSTAGSAGVNTNGQSGSC